MKILKYLVAVFAMVAVAANAQLVQGPSNAKLFNTSSAVLIPGITTSNLPTSLAKKVPIGKDGIAFVLHLGATNAATTTNATITVELVETFGGVDYAVGNQTYTLSVPQNGTAAYVYRTNLVSTTANIGNATSARIRSIQNTNLASIWFTNAVAGAR